MDIINLPDIVVTQIRNFICEKRNLSDLRENYVNSILREDVLDLLDQYCTVIYYPLYDSNNGFHITEVLDKNGNEYHFVFINTAQTIEKQVFTAAHELGHIWDVAGNVRSAVDDSILTDIDDEVIINRFAAELLMPEKEFRIALWQDIKQNSADTQRITIYSMLKITAFLMNKFCTPMKSVVLRMAELNIINVATVQILLEGSQETQTYIAKQMEKIVHENGYIQFEKPSRKKWINGLAELLDKAEAEKTVTSEKISQLRATFDLGSPDVDSAYLTTNSLPEDVQIDTDSLKLSCC